VDTLKAIVENPSLAQADREAAQTELARLEAELNPESGRPVAECRPPHPLEAELLQSTSCACLADVRYGEIHRFCVRHNWSAEVCGLYFEHWLPEYFAKTEWGKRQLGTAIDYVSRRPSPDSELNAAIEAWQALQEVRRRFNTSAEFAAMFTAEQVAEFGLGREDN
jgi:hypothetical protein